MKKIISIVLMLTMLLSVVAVSASADGTLYVQSDFSDMERFAANFIAGAYYTEGDLLFGYSEAKALQTQNEWFVYDAVCEVALADDELDDGERYFSVVYPNTNLMNYGRAENSFYMNFTYDIANRQCFLTGGGVGFLTDNVMITEPVPVEGVFDDGSDYNTFGISVTRGRIRCFIDNKLLIDYVDTNDEYLIGLEDDNTVPTKHVFWNDCNFIQYKDIKVSSPEYLYPTTPVVDDPTPGPNPTPTPNPTPSESTTTKAPETTTSKKVVDVTDDKGNAVTDEKGNKVTEEIIVTDPPVADTNTGAVQGGNSTTTGDATFIVVAALVATIGCALIVRKVNVK